MSVIVECAARTGTVLRGAKFCSESVKKILKFSQIPTSLVSCRPEYCYKIHHIKVICIQMLFRSCVCTWVSFRERTENEIYVCFVFFLLVSVYPSHFPLYTWYTFFSAFVYMASIFYDYIYIILYLHVSLMCTSSTLVIIFNPGNNNGIMVNIMAFFLYNILL